MLEKFCVHSLKYRYICVMGCILEVRAMEMSKMQSTPSFLGITPIITSTTMIGTIHYYYYSTVTATKSKVLTGEREVQSTNSSRKCQKRILCINIHVKFKLLPDYFFLKKVCGDGGHTTCTCR